MDMVTRSAVLRAATLDVLASLAQGLEIPLSELLRFPLPPRSSAA